MGKRRIRLLQQHYSEVNILGVDISENRRQEAYDRFGIATFTMLEETQNTDINCAFICSAPLTHRTKISECLTAGLHVFSELNLVSEGYLENIRLAEAVNKVLFMSSTFLYRGDVRFLIDQIKQNNTMFSYTYHIGQYLSDWHPWESFHDYFVGEKRTGGCREIFAIEIPWILRAFGEIVDLSVHRYNISSLNIPYPDTIMVTVKHKNGSVGQILVDVVTRFPVRHFEAFSETLQLEWRGKPEEVWITKPDFSDMTKVFVKGVAQRENGYRDFIVEDAYYMEIRAFFDTIQGKYKPDYTFHDDLRTLQLVDSIMGAEY